MRTKLRNFFRCRHNLASKGFFLRGKPANLADLFYKSVKY